MTAAGVRWAPGLAPALLVCLAAPAFFVAEWTWLGWVLLAAGIGAAWLIERWRTVDRPVVRAGARLETARDVTASAPSLTRDLSLIAIGLLIGRNAPAFGERAWGIVYKLSMLLVLIAFVPIVVKVWGAMMSLVGDGTLAVMAAVTVVAIVGGHVLGGPDILDLDGAAAP